VVEVFTMKRKAPMYMIKSPVGNYYNVSTGLFISREYATKFHFKNECFAVSKIASKNKDAISNYKVVKIK
jgi:hypothetical protein